MKNYFDYKKFDWYILFTLIVIIFIKFLDYEHYPVHDEVKSNIMRIESRKARLHTLKSAIMKRAHELPETDTEAAFYKVHGNVWRTIHRSAVPIVANLNGYQDLDQIEHAIAGAEMILLRLGGTIPPEQTQLF